MRSIQDTHDGYAVTANRTSPHHVADRSSEGSRVVSKYENEHRGARGTRKNDSKHVTR
jgi:hypothetical protein